MVNVLKSSYSNWPHERGRCAVDRSGDGLGGAAGDVVGKGIFIVCNQALLA